MSVVTKIEPQKKRAGRVNVYIDEEFAFGISNKLLIDFDIYKGKVLTGAELEKIKGAESTSKCMDKAYHFLSFRPRSEKEMRDKLLEKFEPETVGMAIERLKEYNFVNDEDFARMWVNSRGSGRSARALSFELKRKGVEAAVIEEALKDVDKDKELESALELVKSKTKYLGIEKQAAYTKIGGFLSRRGYSYDIIKQVIKELYKD